MSERKPISKRVRFEVLRRDEHTCQYCGGQAPDVKLTVDHVIPVALGGSDDPSNLRTACRDCNAGKSSMPPDAAMVAQVNRDAEKWAEAMEIAAIIERHERSIVSPGVQIVDQLWKLPRSSNWAATVEGYERAGADVDDLRYAIDVAYAALHVPSHSAWQYFCGIMRKILAKRAEMAVWIMEEQEHD